MTPGHLESEFHALVARVAELEAARCTHRSCEDCARAREVAAKMALRQRCADAARMATREFLAMPDAAELCGAMTDEQLRSLVSSATSTAEQDRVLSMLRHNVAFHVDLFCCRELPKYVEITFRGSGTERTHWNQQMLMSANGRLKPEVAAKFAEVGEEVRVYLNPETQKSELFVERKGIRDRTVFGAETLDLFMLADPQFAQAVREECDRRILDHDEAYEFELMRVPRRPLPRKPVS